MLIERIEAEQGRLDILVNNAYPGVNLGSDWVPFWERPLDMWDSMTGIGLRSHFVVAVRAMPLLLRSDGLLVNISSSGSHVYLGSVPYGVGKAGMDAMARFMATELKETGVTSVSLWPGFVRTELMEQTWTEQPEMLTGALTLATAHFQYDPWKADPGSKGLSATESAQFTGRAVVALGLDRDRKRKSGRVLATVLLADEYEFYDVDGRRPDAFHFRRTEQWPALRA